MTAEIFTFERPTKRVSAVVELSRPNVVFSVGSVLAAAAFSVCASSSAAAPNTVNPGHFQSGSASVQVAARKEEFAFCVTDALPEIRERSGLTWDQLAAVLGVTRRTVHSWMSGSSGVARENVARVQEVLSFVRSWGDQPSFRIRNRLFETYRVNREIDQGVGELPILVSDSRPLKNPVARKKSSSMRIRRG